MMFILICKSTPKAHTNSSEETKKIMHNLNRYNFLHRGFMHRLKNHLTKETLGAFNYIFKGARISIDRCNHPIWYSYQSSPPIPYTLKKYSDIHHYWNTISDQSRPFIVECEHVLMLSGESLDYTYMIDSASTIEKKLKNNLCKAIILPTEGALREAEKYINNNNIEHKYFVVKPAYPSKPDKEFNEDGPFSILTIGNKFWGKGIPIAIEIFRILRKRYGDAVKMKLVCGDIPKEYPLVNGIDLLDIPHMDEKTRSRMYNDSHVFLFPCLHDSFGVFLEAMAYGVPMVTTRIYDKDELVIDGKTGFLVETPISMYDGRFGIEYKSWSEFVEQIQLALKTGIIFKSMIEEMVAKIDLLIKDRIMLVKMGKATQRLHRENFSIEVKNQRMREIYAYVYRN